MTRPQLCYIALDHEYVITSLAWLGGGISGGISVPFQEAFSGASSKRNHALRCRTPFQIPLFLFHLCDNVPCLSRLCFSLPSMTCPHTTHQPQTQRRGTLGLSNVSTNVFIDAIDPFVPPTLKKRQSGHRRTLLGQDHPRRSRRSPALPENLLLSRPWMSLPLQCHLTSRGV